ncbi:MULTISPECIES: prolyl oligopeptidase family protein [unclassified Rhizobium]|uniref:prolyl oligopeptidase family serine peptidase n=1 Tax=unclassified Rhizobium TaxID=2613769 RepID=UPI001C82A75A|nr:MULTISPECIES: prolyl oligopeptidase family serine peptidase [unclassified Rhizobium]MBX5166786.1 S9 family peptidase [Rhizobium sp. NZLR4b]MBX5186324.1 S9 family peptidase [Rhizobium sp. NZLR5]
MVPVISRRRFAKTVCAFAVWAGSQRTGFADGNAGKISPPNPDTRPIVYPETREDAVVEKHFGVSVPDPYRWLEGDPRTDAEVASWIDAQQRCTTEYLSSLPGRDVFRRSLISTFGYERIGILQRSGDRYFFTRKVGGQNQPVLVVSEAAGPDRVLIDPSTWSKDGTVAFQEWRASRDGAYVAYAVQDGGSDWRTIRVLDVATGKVTRDVVQWARITQIAWANDGSGFYYSRYPEPKPGVADAAGLVNHAVYFHRIGTPQTDDTLFFATPSKPGRLNSAGLTADGRYAIIYSSDDLVHADVLVVDLERPHQAPRVLVQNVADRWSVIGNVGTELLLTATNGAERSKIVSVDLAAPDSVFIDLVPEQDSHLTGAYIAGDRILASYFVDAKFEMRRYRLDGSPDGIVDLPGIGSVHGVFGEPGNREAFFIYASFSQPQTVYRYDIETGQQSVWIEPEISADLSSITIEQRFFRSKDGTRVPMFIARLKGTAGPIPTLVTGYGAFGSSMPPSYSAMLTPWILQGGAVAIVNTRGGGEYGAAWHEAGRGLKKQNSFDDMIAAAEYLRVSKIAPPDGVAIYGDSAGGLMVGAVVNQRPDLFAAALPSVGVMDMLRFDKFTGGALWLGEYGNPAREEDFRNLLSYSPYHNVKPGKPYPAILVTTGEADNRVVPAHSFKYSAALQAADLGPRPRLLRVDARAGHGTGKPTTKVIEEAADMLAFAAHWTGLETRG